MGLLKILTDPSNFTFYNGGIGGLGYSGDGTKPAMKSLKFGNDRPGGGDSGQPFIQSPIGDQNQPSALDTDFLLRGGINAPRNAAKDISRLTQYFVTPQGVAFIAKQQLLSRTGVKTEASGIVNGGIYTPLSTLAQAGVGFLGGHLNKQGLDPTGIISAFSIKDYGPVVYQKNQDNENRLVELLNSTTITRYNPNPNIRSYPGGPGSTLGIGNTNIKFSTYEDGTPIRTFNKKNYLVGKPFDKIEPNKWILPINLSSKYNDLVYNGSFSSQIPYDLITGSNSYQEYGNNSVYESGSLIARKDINSYLTSSYEVITRNSGSIKYTSSINNTLKSSGRQLVIDSKYQTDTGHFEAFSPLLPNKPLGRYSSKLTLITDPQHVGTQDIEKSENLNSPETQGYLANLNKNSGNYVDDNELITYHNPYRVGGRGISYDFRKTLRSKRGFNDVTNPQFPQYDYILPLDIPDYSKVTTIDKIYYKNNDKRESSNINSGEDIINFRISIVNPTSLSKQTTLQFKAYIDSFSDSYNADWKEQNYMGRAESFFKYTAFSRDISLGFTIIAPSSNNLEIMYNQLNTLASSMAPTYTKSGYMAGNLHRITMGNYINQQYGVITGFTYEIMDESPWEINQSDQLPHYIKVTGLNFKVIHDFRPESQFTEPNRSLKFIDQ
jgi:hypothetical protein